MKRKLLLATLIALGSTTMAFASPQQNGNCPPPPAGFGCGDGPACQKPCDRPPMNAKGNIEEKLKLTTEQKAKAKQLRMDAREQMQPIMEAIKTKQEQKEIIKRNQSLTAAAQCEQVEKLNKQISELKKQARDIRMKNEKDFESILTQKQKKQLDKIKEEARKNMDKNKKQGPPPKGPQK
jgi:Spy/CpxP family protein refolding chaperone